MQTGKSAKHGKTEAKIVPVWYRVSDVRYLPGISCQLIMMFLHWLICLKCSPSARKSQDTRCPGGRKQVQKIRAPQHQCAGGGTSSTACDIPSLIICKEKNTHVNQKNIEENSHGTYVHPKLSGTRYMARSHVCAFSNSAPWSPWRAERRMPKGTSARTENQRKRRGPMLALVKKSVFHGHAT